VTHVAIFFRSAIWALPAFGIGAMVAAVVYPVLALRFGVRRYVMFGWLLALLLVLALTLTPQSTAHLGAGMKACWTTVQGPIGFSSYGNASQRSLNVVLFVPLGLFTALMPRRYLAALCLLGLVLPMFVEALQYQLPSLDRQCAVVDVVDNETGFVLGVVIGLTLRWLIHRVRRYLLGVGPTDAV
jgi:glycopeptide antibiotics resistance protein